MKIAPDEVLEKTRKKESEDRDKGEEKQVGDAKAKWSRDNVFRGLSLAASSSH